MQSLRGDIKRMVEVQRTEMSSCSNQQTQRRKWVSELLCKQRLIIGNGRNKEAVTVQRVGRWGKEVHSSQGYEGEDDWSHSQLVTQSMDEEWELSFCHSTDFVLSSVWKEQQGLQGIDTVQ